MEMIFVYVVCNDHLEEAIDDFLDVYDQSPDFYELDKISFTDWTTPNTCDYCDKKPKYLVV